MNIRNIMNIMIPMNIMNTINIITIITMNNIGAIQQVKSIFLFISSTLFLGCHGQPGHGQCGTERVDPVV